MLRGVSARALLAIAFGCWLPAVATAEPPGLRIDAPVEGTATRWDGIGKFGGGGGCTSTMGRLDA